MGERRRGFTLIELLVVIAIIAVLAAMMAPVLVSARRAVEGAVAGRTGKQLFVATALYATDYDDTYPLAMFDHGDGYLQTWFGLQTAQYEFDRQQGMISPYIKGFLQADPTHHAKPFLGDGTGFGYNYGYIGSDFSITLDYSTWPNCTNPAAMTTLSYPSRTVIYATSAFYSAPWLPDGDGQKYDFGFIDAPSGWNGNPNVDFRHWDSRKVDLENRKVLTTGRAYCIFGDGHVATRKEHELDDTHFERQPNVLDLE